jgi:glutamine amidotransferase
MALVSPHRIIGVNFGLGHQGETDPAGDWEELRESGPGTDDFVLSMLLEPMYMLLGRNFQDDETTYDFEDTSEENATSVIFASEPLTEGTDDWLPLEFGEIVFLEKSGEDILKTVSKLDV